MNPFTPSYINLLHSGELKKRVFLALDMLQTCRLCAKYCLVDRRGQNKSGRKPFCRTWKNAVVDSYGPHFGEERPISGYNGSGTIFFSWCNMKCVYCQNWSISQHGEGVETTPETLAEIMLYLQNQGCHNINLVSPSHVIYPIISAIHTAAHKGLRLPIVYNSGGYDSPEGLSLMEGIVDIYMPDMKYGNEKSGREYSHVSNYPKVNRAAVKEMHRQVGDLELDEDGIALRGLLIRHLVLPNSIAGTKNVLKFISEEISKDTWINVMDQYRPYFNAERYPDLNRCITSEEFLEALKNIDKLGLKNRSL